MVTAFVLLLLAQRQRVATPAQPAGDWKIEITTEGGITGTGTGGLSVSSDGTLVITLINKKPCAFHLTAEELQTLNAAIGGTHPMEWLECYSFADVMTQCCDLVRTTLRVTLPNRHVYVTSWLTGTPPFPADLASLVDALRGPAGIDARYRPLCTP